MIGFAEFFGAVYGEEPYPWQRRVADLCASGGPPAVIAVPTGTGKTATVDALLWALAQQADRPAAERTVGARIVWAIDRRILVDEVHDRARKLVAILDEAHSTPSHALNDMAQRLSRLSGGAPLVATRWRGGIDERPDSQEPFQAEIITSTVAQVGSRLLFRGYGLGERSMAMAAGIAACDSTICLDEAHLAEPFRQTVDSIRRLRSAVEKPLPLPRLSLVTLTATPVAATDDEVIRLGDDDREVLAPRLNAPKRATLVEPESDRDRNRETLLADIVTEYVNTGAPTVACVVNTVHRARGVFDQLGTRLSRKGEVDLALLIGPQRPWDRQAMLDKHRAVLLEGESAPKPLVVVATQTFEVGLDADVSAMVTESASATSLVQRFGRLNRGGTPGNEGRATVVRDSDRWLYAAEEPAAWEWLGGQVGPDGSIDISVGSLDEDGSRPVPHRPARAPALTPQVVELLLQTSPRPTAWADPDIDVFLRGVDAEPNADVSLCWRRDLREDRVDDEAAEEYREMLLDLVPPQPQELLSLSVTAARALIATRYPAGSGTGAAARMALADTDVEGGTAEQQPPSLGTGGNRVPFLVLRRGAVLAGTLQRTEASVDPRSLRPGDVLIMPTSAGGVDGHGLAPKSATGTDVAQDLCDGGSPAPVRISQEALGLDRFEWSSTAAACRRAERGLLRARDAPVRAEIIEELVGYLSSQLPSHPGLRLLAPEALAQHRYALNLRGVGSLTSADEALADAIEDDESPPLPGEGETDVSEDRGPEAPDPGAWVLLPLSRADLEQPDRMSPDTPPPPSINEHARAVHDQLESSLARLDPPPEIRAALLLAARAHDHGKADPRIQAFFRRGRHLIGATPIAKSEFGTRDPATARTARQLAGLPRGLRHEISSVAILSDAVGREERTEPRDIDLALHLVGTHHGLGRPVPRAPTGGSPAREFLADAAGITGRARGDTTDAWDDGAWLERFWKVVGLYGAWGAAYLEALLILADRTVSSRGS